MTDKDLIAVQPNRLHIKAPYLPLHLDFPGNDGFGVIIVVTVAIQGSGTIVVVDEGDNDDGPRIKVKSRKKWTVFECEYCKFPFKDKNKLTKPHTTA